MDFGIFPSENSVGQINSSDTRKAREQTMTDWMWKGGTSTLESFVRSGLTLSVPGGGGLSVDIAVGDAMISGYLVVATGTTSDLGSLTPSRAISAPNYIYLQLTRSSNLVTGASFVANTTGTAPAFSTLVGIAATNGTDTIQVLNIVGTPPVITGTYTGDSVASRDIYLGRQPKFVLIFGWGSFNVLSGSGLAVGSSVKGFVVQGTAGADDADLTIGDGTTTLNLRPELTLTGFKVAFATGVGLNESGVPYWYIAWM